MFDNDKAGESGAWDSVKALKDRCIVKKTSYPKNCTYKDPAEIIGAGREKIIRNMLKKVVA